MELLKDARDRAGLTQRELARRAGTSQAMVARIERGQQSPSVATLERLVRACGLELRVETAGEDGPPADPAGPAARTGRLLVWRSGSTAYAFPLEAVERIAEHRSPVEAAGPAARRRGGDGRRAGHDGARRGGKAGDGRRQRRRRSSSSASADGRRAVVVDRAESLADEAVDRPGARGSAHGRVVVGLADVDGERVVVLDPDGFCG